MLIQGAPETVDSAGRRRPRIAGEGDGRAWKGPPESDLGLTISRKGEGWKGAF